MPSYPTPRYTAFRHLAIRDPKPPPTDAQIMAVQRQLGASLPELFRQFMLVANGGYLEYLIDVPVGDGRTEALSFCGLFSADDGDTANETLVGEILRGRARAGLRVGVLPFARDGGGSIVYLDLSPHGSGRVVAFVQGLPPWAGVRTEPRYIELAGSFEEYVAALRPDRGAVLEHLAYDVEDLSHVEAIEAFLAIGIPDWRDDEELRDAVAAARRRVSG